jgi:hypothetical protein
LGCHTKCIRMQRNYVEEWYSHLYFK